MNLESLTELDLIAQLETDPGLLSEELVLNSIRKHHDLLIEFILKSLSYNLLKHINPIILQGSLKMFHLLMQNYTWNREEYTKMLKIVSRRADWRDGWKEMYIMLHYLGAELELDDILGYIGLVGTILNFNKLKFVIEHNFLCITPGYYNRLQIGTQFDQKQWDYVQNLGNILGYNSPKYFQTNGLD